MDCPICGHFACICNINRKTCGNKKCECQRNNKDNLTPMPSGSGSEEVDKEQGGREVEDKGRDEKR
ncbi:hypothetical protein HYFRA_00003327 [Hymenoscyphus fraxineus]|uniref:Metallothionein n=1 Tax=Hymenoscyphus fraxineus TaxID=746836 RepID=A0A9N9KSL8_9HELO|nr:hypothetical protein HYFRA_00003327 [Hymenoscyphus fraxineus]